MVSFRLGRFITPGQSFGSIAFQSSRSVLPFRSQMVNGLLRTSKAMRDTAALIQPRYLSYASCGFLIGVGSCLPNRLASVMKLSPGPVPWVGRNGSSAPLKDAEILCLSVEFCMPLNISSKHRQVFSYM